MSSNLTTALSWVGIVTVAVSVVKVYQFSSQYTTAHSVEKFKHKRNPDGASPWALITHSSSPLGKAYALSLASRGFNLLLQGSSQSKLAAIKAAILKAHPGVEIRILICDASQSGDASRRDIAGIAESIKDLHITVLINNLSVASYHHEKGAAQAVDVDVDALINANTRFPVLFTRAVLPILLGHKGKAVVVNMLSDGDSAVVTGAQVRDVGEGSSGFVRSWSRALEREMRAAGGKVEVVAVNVGRVLMGEEEEGEGKKSWLTPTVNEFVESVLNYCVGGGNGVVEGWWGHGLREMFAGYVPNWYSEKVVVDSMRVAMKEVEKKKKAL